MGISDGVEKALVADLAPTSIRATAIGLHATLVGIGLLPASLLAGWMWTSFGPAVPFYFGGVLGCAAAVAVLVVLGKS
jgi:MFS family permease